MITDERIAKMNLIIEAASLTINNVVLAICDPADPDHRADWLERYGAIEDLNIVTVTGVDDYLDATRENIERYPSGAFFIDEIVPDPRDDGEETFIASLGFHVIVQGETFAMIQRELHEVHHAVRSILLHNKALGVISGLGGLIDHIRWARFMIGPFEDEDQQQHLGEGTFYYEIAYREMIYR